MTLIDDLSQLRADLHSIPVDLGLPQYRYIAIRKQRLTPDSFIPVSEDYLLTPQTRVVNVPHRLVGMPLSNGTIAIAENDYLVENLPRIYKREFLTTDIEYYILDPEFNDDEIVNGIRCQFLDVLDKYATKWQILLRVLPDRDPIAPAPLVAIPDAPVLPMPPLPQAQPFVERFVASYTDLASANYYYYGGISPSDVWIINRYSKASLTKTTARNSSNPDYITLDAAWSDRDTLTYS